MNRQNRNNIVRTLGLGLAGTVACLTGMAITQQSDNEDVQLYGNLIGYSALGLTTFTMLHNLPPFVRNNHVQPIFNHQQHVLPFADIANIAPQAPQAF